MKKTFLGITWAAAQNIYWFPVVLGVACVTYYLWHRKRLLVRLLLAPQWTGVLLKNYSPEKNTAKMFLSFGALLFLFLSLLRPQWGTQEKIVQQEGRELFIALDISRSMLASDIKPNRLAFAKSKIKRLLQLLPADRVGLVVFSGTAVVQCPLTRDRSLFSMFLNHLDADTISSGTTAIDQVIGKVIGVLNELPTRKNKLVVVFTDGEDFSRNLSQIRQEAQEMGLHIFTYGVGTEKGAPIPILDEKGFPQGYEKNAQGNVILSRLNEGILGSLSHETGGKYISPTQSDADLKSLVADVERYEKESFDDKELSREEERYPYFLAGTFVCLLLEWLL